MDLQEFYGEPRLNHSNYPAAQHPQSCDGSYGFGGYGGEGHGYYHPGLQPNDSLFKYTGCGTNGACDSAPCNQPPFSAPYQQQGQPMMNIQAQPEAVPQAQPEAEAEAQESSGFLDNLMNMNNSRVILLILAMIGAALLYHYYYGKSTTVPAQLSVFPELPADMEAIFEAGL